MEKTPPLSSRIYGALLGLAIGDAIGLPADFHRSVRTPWVRGRMWDGSAELDRVQVSRPLLPFEHGSTPEPSLLPTDDTEAAVLALRVLLDTHDQTDGELFAQWRRHALRDDVWCGIAERSAILNARRGLLPPQTGNDNPAEFSDSAGPGGIGIGLAFPGDPDGAADHAERWASITHARDGVWAAVALARAAAHLVAGTPFEAAVADATAHVPEGSWLGANLARAAQLDVANGFAAIPDLIDLFGSRVYSFGCAAPETIPLVFAIIRATAQQPEWRIPLAATISRHSDSLPAVVGALTGAEQGVSVFGSHWPDALDRVGGVQYPSLAGESLRSLADTLTARASAQLEATP